MLNLYFRLKAIADFHFTKILFLRQTKSIRHIVFRHNVVIEWTKNIIFAFGITIIGYGE